MLSNLKCLVTGASSGIGQATCEVLTRYGAKVVGTGRNQSSLQSLQSQGSIVDYIVADITQSGECERVVISASEILNGLTTLVNAAGVLQGGAMGEKDTNLENYEFNMTVNAKAPFELMMHAIPHLRQVDETKKDDNGNSCSPSIVNVSSINGKQSMANCVTYCMSKAAVDQMTRCASIDLAKDGIRVNAVNPGVIATNLQKTGGMSEEAYQSFLQRSIQVTHPLAQSLGRVGTAEEVGELIAFLVSSRAKFLTGECIGIDGGRQNLGAR